ncbi:helicase-related protein [uncultured Clostridium sp.]|uniref:helicase-related protein n=1 Tax=uncultured Clostridium sp. TaxID=59620 RepID=UPI0028EC7443|nr:helicase-related protein [uncultured Clostridium sp.]
MEEKIYDTIKIDGYYHKVATMKYDSDKNVRYIIGSFLNQQLLNNCLTLMQKGDNISIDGTKYHSIRKGYLSKSLRVKDENNGDGVHSIIFDDNKDTIRVYQGENKVNKVFEYLKANTECGLLDEWRSYFYNELYSTGYIEECEGFDYTGKAPTILLMKNIDTTLVRNIKALGLKNKSITLPVNEVKEIDPSMSFLEIIEKLIIPNIEQESCHYNIGEPISDIFKAPIINMETGKKKHLFPRQAVIAQGCLNAIKSGVSAPVLNLGCGTGKTLISSRLSHAVINEHFKTENARIGLMMPSHLLNKWIRELKEAFMPLGVNPTFHVINRFRDVDKLSKKPNGIEIIIFQKDITKRTYLHEFSGIQKHKNNDIYKYIDSMKNREDDIIIENCNILKISEMKLAAIRLEKIFQKKIVLYKQLLDKEDNIVGYKVISTSKTILNIFGKSNKAYDFIVDDIQNIKEIVIALKDTIKEEKLIKTINILNVDNPIICPSCGGAVYIHGTDMFDPESHIGYLRYAPDDMTSLNLHCNHYIKADGTNLTEAEISAIRRDDIHVIYTSKAVRNAYLDDDGNELEGEELRNAKKKGHGYSVIVKKCNHNLWGAKDQKGFRDYDSAKYFRKRFGKNGLNILIIDEFHDYQKNSNQMYSFSNLCKTAKVLIPLSATLTGGKASDLFYILWNLYPQLMVNLGFKYNEIGRFVDMFGRRKRTTKTYYETYNKSGNGRVVRGSWVEIPGISPQVVNVLLSSRMVSRTLNDMAIPMPNLRYFKHEIEMDDDLTTGYNRLQNDILSFIKKHRGINIGGSYLNSLLSYPDMPEQKPIVMRGDMHIATPTWIDTEGRIFNKEKKLIETIERELLEDRRVLLYSIYSGTKGVSKRLVDLLSNKFKVAELTSKIKRQKREEWIEKQYQNGVEILITNPKCVDTGLDIIQYPTVYCYESSYDIKVMRQAEVRPHRPNSTKECRVYYSYYKNTLQEDALKLQGNKKASSLAVEGVFSEDMLSQMGDLGESPASILNKILQGKVKLKESDLDAFAFEEEQPNQVIDINNNDVIISQEVIATSENSSTDEKENSQLSIFEIDEEFLKNRPKKKAKVKVSLGQLGFIFE